MYYHVSSWIEVYLYTNGNIILPREKSGLYGSTFMKYKMPTENTSFSEKIFVYKDVVKPLASSGLGCTNNRAEDSVGRCIVRKVEEESNCTTYGTGSKPWSPPLGVGKHHILQGGKWAIL